MSIYPIGLFIEVFCQELDFDQEEFAEVNLVGHSPDQHTFCLHLPESFPHGDYAFSLPDDVSHNATFWHWLITQLAVPQHPCELRLYRVHAGNMAKILRHHHILITEWKPGLTPGLLSVTMPQSSEIQYVVHDFQGCYRGRDLVPTALPIGADQEDPSLWKNGQALALDAIISYQCGSFFQLDWSSKQPSTCRVDEPNIVDPPQFEVDADEMIVLPEDVQGQDDVMVVIRDDENTIVQLLSALTDNSPLNIIMFGYDGTPLGRRDREIQPASYEALQRAIAEAWNDYPSHLAKSYLVQPQPAALVREGLVLVVALQHVFAGAPVPEAGSVLCLAGIQLSYAGAHEPEIFRPFAVPETAEVSDIRRRLQVQDLCQPYGRRSCHFIFETTPMTEDSQHNARPGSFVLADIQAERAMFDIHRACRDVDSILSDISVAQNDPLIRQIKLIQFGYRFRSIGTVNQFWIPGSTVDSIGLAQHFAQGWIGHPLDRMQIFRVKAMDSVDSALGVLALHFIVSFDLIPGHTVCVALHETMSPWVIAGAHLLRPEFWYVNGLDHDVVNPLSEGTYDFLSFQGRVPTLLAQPGDAIVYVTPQTANDIEAPIEDTDELSALQLPLRQPLQERNFAATPAGGKRRPAFEIGGHDREPVISIVFSFFGLIVAKSLCLMRRLSVSDS